MRFFKILLVVVIGVIAIGIFVAEVPFGPSEETFVDIAPGTSTAGMAQELARAGVIRSSLAFEAMKAVHGGVLKAGEYRFDHPVKLAEVYSRIRRGDVFTISVTIPEGYNIFEIAQAVSEAGLKPRMEFLQAEMQDTALVKAWAPNAVSLEGFLFPDTYRFSRHATTHDMLAAMVRRFGVMAAKLGLEAGAGTENADSSTSLRNGNTGGEGSSGLLRVLTMASLVEREVHVDSERALVASVFENRLAAGMPLQTDPSVVYGSMLRGTWTGVIHQSELHSDSAYNTYVHAGLPPGPICNPGVAALKAALHPASSDYLYFVATAGGQTKFSSTISEHDANVAAYRAATGQTPVPVVRTPETRLVEKHGSAGHTRGRRRR